MAAPVTWIDTERRRGERDRRAAVDVPKNLPLLGPDERLLLERWARRDNATRRRQGLLQEAGASSIERAEALCEKLLGQGWIERREQLVGGRWQWESITWRDLPVLQRLLGIESAARRVQLRDEGLAKARDWLRSRAESAAADPDLLDEMTGVLDELALDRAIRSEVLEARLGLLKSLGDWADQAGQGTRRDFALRARGTTKSLGVADWRWLESRFDLERLRITPFAPMFWLAGDVSLHWEGRRVDLGGLHCAALPMRDLKRVERIAGQVVGWWLLENRASFERQAQGPLRGRVLVWLPGRPSSDWLEVMSHLLDLAPCEGYVSADADPAGVDIACTVGALWEREGLAWQPHLMGVPEWQSASQHWALNDHDRELLARLLARPTLPEGLRALCEQMQREGRKAEQEGWL